MPTARGGSSSIEIAATPGLVYDLITDVIRMGEWSPECYRCEWLDGATVAAPGVRFRGYNRRGRLRWTRTAVIESADRGREFSFTTVHGGAGREETRWRYALAPSSASTSATRSASSSAGTLLTESFEFLWCSVPNRLVEALLPRGRQVNRGIEETLRRIKRAAESPA
jgi:Polyketide cyclase / dehydrase and lipid transport